MKHLLLIFVVLLYPLFTTKAYTPVSKDKQISVFVSNEEKEVVYTSVNIFGEDIKDITGTGIILTDKAEDADIVSGTISKNNYIDALTEKGLIQTDKIKGRREAFQIQTLTNTNTKKKQVIITGSDSRGTAYGILELSRVIGVSPWKWWADVMPEKKETIEIPDNLFIRQEPSVQYRGIFLNDEDWGLMPWSSKNYEPSSQKGRIGPKTYAKIFELLLRLKANTIWPAMHECTVPFYFTEGNKEMADKYGIVVGTSHCEPLMRNSAGEWDTKKYGDYNYLTNKNTVSAYWEERLKEAGSFENFYTIGMRGVHDGKMEGVKTLDEQTRVLSDVISDQNDLLKKYVNTDLGSIPRSFVPYKEVLNIYENGLNVPDDITLTWCDDNYGYITRLSNENERRRKGGAGIYYHISYWGRPHDYLWLSTTSPSQIYYQMKTAWDKGARKLWILNVGDIKPGEYCTEFFLDMAWNIDRINNENIYTHREEWLKREFGEEVSAELSFIMNEYYRLANIRKPEFMGWSRVEEYSAIKGGKTPVIDAEFNPYAFGDEIHKRLTDYTKITDRAKELEKLIATDRKSAYFQLILYPVCASAEMNKKLLYALKARLYASYNLPVANEYAQKSINAYNAIASLTYTYNHDISEGKWAGMMDMKPRNLDVFARPDLPDKIKETDTDDIFILAENSLQPVTGRTIKLIPFVVGADSKTFVSLFTYQNKCFDVNVKSKPDWLIAEEENLGLFGEKRLNFSIDHNKLQNSLSVGECTVNINNREYVFQAEVHASKGMPAEYNGMVILDAAEYKSNGINKPITIQGLGYSAGAQLLKPGKENTIKYKIYTASSGNAIIRTCLIPNHPTEGGDIRYAISIDNEEPRIVSFKTEFRSEAWKINVLRNLSVNITEHNLDKPGEHTISFYALDEGVILDRIMLDFQPDRIFYEIPSGMSKRGR